MIKFASGLFPRIPWNVLFLKYFEHFWVPPGCSFQVAPAPAAQASSLKPGTRQGMSEKLCPAAGRAKSIEHPPGVCVLHMIFTLRVCLYMIRTHAFPPFDALELRRLACRLVNSSVARLASSRPSDPSQPTDNPHSILRGASILKTVLL